MSYNVILCEQSIFIGCNFSVKHRQLSCEIAKLFKNYKKNNLIDIYRI